MGSILKFLAPTDKKKCKGCGQTKNAEEFYEQRRQCKSCISKQMKEYYQKNREKIIARNSAYYNEYVRTDSAKAKAEQCKL